MNSLDLLSWTSLRILRDTLLVYGILLLFVSMLSYKNLLSFRTNLPYLTMFFFCYTAQPCGISASCDFVLRICDL